MEVLQMIKQNNIAQVFNTFPKNTPISLADIQDAVKQIVAPADLNIPYTTTRPSGSYPMWKHRVQATLSEYKKQGKVIHDAKNHTYSFL